MAQIRVPSIGTPYGPDTSRERPRDKGGPSSDQHSQKSIRALAGRYANQLPEQVEGLCQSPPTARMSLRATSAMTRALPNDDTPAYQNEFFAYFVINTSPRGNFSKTSGSCEKFVARMSTGLPAIHCDRLMV
jgi:hypothetical protein